MKKNKPNQGKAFRTPGMGKRGSEAEKYAQAMKKKNRRQNGSTKIKWRWEAHSMSPGPGGPGREP